MTGWLRDSEDPAPALIDIRHDGATVARAAAMLYRPDLLRAGHGHGHYGFAARLLRPVPPGPAVFALFLPRRGQGIQARVVVPPREPAPALTVEDLLARGPHWTAAEIAGTPEALRPAAQHAALGTTRFVDAAFRFALARWPSAAEAEVYGAALAEARLTPAALLVELLTGRERAEIAAPPPGPWDADFPFARSEAIETA